MKSIKNITKLFAVLLTLAISSGCADQSSILTKDIWTFSNISHDSEDEVTATFLALGEALLEDATMEFQESGDYIITPKTGNPTFGTWELLGDDKIIISADGDNDPSTATILELTKTTFSYSEMEVDFSLNAYTATTTWIR